MTLFRSFRPLLRIAVELERIATVLEYFAINDAQRNNRMFMPKRARSRFKEDESDLAHTDPVVIQHLREEDYKTFLASGYPTSENE